MRPRSGSKGDDVTRIRAITLGTVFVLVAAACGGSPAPAAPVGTNPPTPPILPLATTAAPAPVTTTVPTTTSPPATTSPATTEPPPPITVPPITLPPTQEQLALSAALEISAAVISGRTEGVFEISGIEGALEDTVAALRFSGAFDTLARASSFLMDMSELAAAVPSDELPPEMADFFGEIEMRQIGEISYVKFPFFSVFLGVETEWIAFPQDQQSVAEAVSPVTPINPTEFLDLFSSIDAGVADQGREVLRGVDTTHYLVTFSMEELLREADPEELAELQAMGPLPFDTLPMDIWISDDGLIHRFELVLDSANGSVYGDEEFGRMVMRFDMFDHNQPVEILPPPAEEVTDVSDLGFFFES